MAETNLSATQAKGHPKGLYVLFFTELWERFSYYGMRALLFLYLTKHFLLADDAAYAVFGAYAALVYASPVLGGLIADRYLGYRKAVILGGVLLVLGHMGMAFEGAQAVEVDTASGSVVERDEFAMQILYLSLGFIATGVGFLKANISTLVGTLYELSDRRRDSGFTIFYMGINVGAFIGPLICGFLGETYGWSYGFGLAGIGMALGLVVFMRGQKYLMGKAEPPNPALLRQKTALGLNVEHLIYLTSFAMILVTWQLVQIYAVVGIGLVVLGVAVSGGIVWYSLANCSDTERSRHLVILALMFFSVIFWSLFEQAGSSLTAFADRVVDRDAFGVTIQTSQLQSLNPIFIILLAPIFSSLWINLERRNRNLSTPTKFALGILQAGLGFLVLVYGVSQAGDDGKVALIWLALAYLLHTTGELCLSPVGLSAITKLSTPAIGGTLMGAWFLSMAGASYIASLFARLTSMETEGGQITDIAEATVTFSSLFQDLFWLAAAMTLVAFLVAPMLSRAMRGAD